MARNRRDGQIEYVYELPFIERRKFCKILNQNDKWEDLAGHMKYDVLTIDELRRDNNPTDILLEKWSHHNHRIIELFILLSKMQHYQSMILLKPFVDPKYHRLISEGESNFRRLYHREVGNSNEKDLKIAPQNFNQVQSAQTNNKKVVINNQINKESGAAKILNSPPQPSSVLVPSDSDNMMAPPSIPSPDISPAQQPEASTAKINNESKFLSDNPLPQISYDELARATGGWKPINILGKGGFGTVFKGRWKHTEVAIKRIEQRGPDSIQSYLIQLQQSSRELKILNQYRHDNILSLYAYSIGPEAPCLVYQFMINGSLEDRLLSKKQSKPLTWLQRHNIAKGTARGLQFLHTIGEKPLIHGDIKSANILLDKNFEPRIGDFGLAREGPEKDSMKVSRIHGTRPYLPNEFLQYKALSTKIDTYSYGIVLFELATGLSAYDDGRPVNKFLKDFIDSHEPNHLPFLKDEKAGAEDEQVYENLIVLGKWCSNRLPEHRPEMVLVLQKIDEL